MTARRKISLCLLFSCLLAPLCAETKETDKRQFWHKGPHLTLPHRNDRGYGAAAVMKVAAFKIPHPRKAPVAAFLPDGKTDRPGQKETRRIPLCLKEEAGVARNAWIRTGLPLPRGAVFQTRNLRITDARGKEIPAQKAVTGFWPDGSLKWVLVQFSAPMEARGEAEYFAEFGENVVAAPVQGLAWHEDAERFTVDTGKITAVISKKKFNLIESVFRNGKRLGGFSPEGVRLGDPVTGRDFTISAGPPESFAVSEAGPLRLTLRVAGKYRNGNKTLMDYVARLTFLAGSATADIEFTHIDTALEREFTDVSCLDIVFTPASPVTRLAVPVEGGKKELPAKRIFQETDEYYSVDGNGRISGRFGGVALCGGETPFSAGIADAWKRYPKAFSLREGSLVFELLPRQPHKDFNRDLPYYLVYPFCDGMYRMKWGMSFTERIRLDFSDAATLEAELNMPVVAVLPAKWYDASGVFPGLVEPGFDAIDKKIIGSFGMRLEQMKSQREYGFFNWGDSFGEKGENWTNNEYDLAHGLFMTFLRTGDRRLFRHALAAARHQADVDICHAYPDPYYVGGNLNHGAGHTGRYKVWSFRYGYYQSAANGHTWTWGMVNAWNLAGDAVVMDAALLSGDHIALAMTPNFKMGPNPQAPRECSWAIKAVGKMYEATLDPVYLAAMKELAFKNVKRAEESPGGVWSFRNPRLVNERGEKSLGNTIFITAVGLKGLCEYYQVSRDDALKPAIRRIADRIALAFEPWEGCGFTYDLRQDGRRLNYPVVYMNLTIAPALAEAAVILDDPKLYDIARRGAAAGLLRAPGFTGKFLGEYQTFLTDFLAAHRKFPAKYKLDFKDLSMLRLTVRGEQVWNRRAPDPGVYLLRLRRDGDVAVTMNRWLWPSPLRIKKPDAGVTFSRGVPQRDAQGNIASHGGEVIGTFSFDSSKGGFTKEFKLSGKKGDTFIISVRDNNNGGWCIVPSPAHVSAGVVGQVPFKLTRCGLNRVYFEVPAETNVSFSYYGTHCGAFGYWLFDENGKLIRAGSTWQPELSLRKTPARKFMVRLPRKNHRRVCSLVFYAEFDARLKFNNVKFISGSRDFFE
ncbi:MAG: hypothetical protein IJS01_07725 [Lentisphaeria bacterium]|nr:hypothetical protein [Lentisphaeria bacterium]